MWTEENLIIAAIILDEEQQEQLRKRKRRFWIHSISKQRNIDGEYVTLFPKLIDDDIKFHQYFRMSKHQFYELLSNIEEPLRKQNTIFRKALTPKQKLCVCLRFLATGDNFRTIAFSYRLGHSTVCTIVKEVCEAIINIMLSKVMPQPKEEDWKRIAQEYWDNWNFPNCLGAIDGKHVVITAPANSGSQYFNYKKTFSIVLLALVDAQYNFIAVDIGSFGKNSDGGIFAHSNLGKALEKGILNIPSPRKLPSTERVAPFVIVGDEAFPLQSNLLRPYSSIQQRDDNEKKIFNYRLSRARRCSENAFGILGQKFQLYNRRLKSAPEYADKIVLTTCILHNFIRDYRTNAAENVRVNTDCILTPLPKRGGNAERNAFEIRDMYKQFFNSEVGAVEWQLNQI